MDAGHSTISQRGEFRTVNFTIASTNGYRGSFIDDDS